MTASTHVGTDTPRSAGGLERSERPWGSWRVLDVGVGYKVKRLEVAPGHRLSYQVHQHRSEDWLVVAGIATCVVNGETFLLRPGDHLFVERGAAHRIGNSDHQRLVIIETQRGPYTGEDDIVRLADDYDRAGTT